MSRELVYLLVLISTLCVLGCSKQEPRSTHPTEPIASSEPETTETNPWVIQTTSDIDPGWMNELLDGAHASHTDALVVLHRGEQVFAWPAPDKQTPIEMMSATKPFVALAVGLLVEQGKLDVNAPVSSFFVEWEGDPRGSITIEHLLHHTSGLVSPTPTMPIYESGDFLRFALDSQLEALPGETFRYNNNGVNLLAGIVEEVSGESIADLLERELFSPMQITDFTWARDAAGNTHGMSGLALRASDAAKIGQLFLDRGEWRGEQLIPASWIDYMLTPSARMTEMGALIWRTDIADSYTLDDALLQEWATWGVSKETIEVFEPVRNKQFASPRDFFDAVRAILANNPNARREFTEHIEKPNRPFFTATNKRLGLIHHQGNVGQYMIAIPTRDIVVIRQLVETAELQRETFEEKNLTYTFQEIFPLCIKLAASRPNSPANPGE